MFFENFIFMYIYINNEILGKNKNRNLTIFSVNEIFKIYLKECD